MSPVDENEKMKLLPFFIKQEHNIFLIIKKEDCTVLKTSEVGIKAVKMLNKGKTIKEIKEILSKEYNVEESTININPLLETLIENRFISIIGDKTLYTSEKKPWSVKLKFFVTFILQLKLFHFIYHYMPICLTYFFFKKIFFKKIKIHEGKREEIEKGLHALNYAGLMNNIQDIVEDNIRLLNQIEFDKTLFFELGYRNLRTWLDKFFIVENMEILLRNIKQNKGTILCGFHTGNYYSSPFVLAKNHFEVHTPVVLEEGGIEIVVERIKKIDQEAFPLKMHIYKRGKYDGVRLFRVLKKGGIILLYCDTHIALTNDLMEVEFFGRRIRANRGVVFLHKKTNSPIIPVLTYNRGNYCYVKLLDAIYNMQNFTEQEILQKLFSILQNFLVNSPEQWAKWPDLRKMSIDSII
jgi:lauroyl/myristoyl acyltransferase